MTGLQQRRSVEWGLNAVDLGNCYLKFQLCELLGSLPFIGNFPFILVLPYWGFHSNPKFIVKLTL